MEEVQIIHGSSSPDAALPLFPTHSVEFVNTVAHYYRGEVARMISWRDRIDRTTNWAIASVAAMLSFSLSAPDVHHSVLLFAMIVVSLLLGIEARRYRFFNVYRSRVRLLERSYYANVFAPAPVRDTREWTSQLAADLRAPRFTITTVQALARRLRRTYFSIYLILLLAWVTKGSVIGPETADLFSRYAVGWIPGLAIVIAVAAFFAAMIFVMIAHRELPGELAFGDVHM